MDKNYSVKDILTNHYLANYLPNSFKTLDNTLCDVCVKTCGVKNKETYWLDVETTNKERIVKQY